MNSIEIQILFISLSLMCMVVGMMPRVKAWAALAIGAKV